MQVLKLFFNKMIKIKITVILLLVFAAITSCRTELDSDFPNATKTAVLNCIAVSDSTLKVHISVTDDFGGKKEIPNISNAFVLAQQGSIVDTLQYLGNSIYGSKFNIKQNKKYALKAVVANLDTIYAEQNQPQKTEIISTKYIKKAAYNEEGYISAVDVEFKNSPKQNCYYEIVLKFWEGSMLEETSNIDPKDSVILAEGIPSSVFSNKLFYNDSSHSVRIVFQGSYYYPEKYLVELRAVSEDYYKYVQSEYLYMMGRYPAFSFSSVVPSTLYSNVKGGLGIFASYSKTETDTIFIEQTYEDNL